MYTQVAADLYTGEFAGGQLLLPVGTRFIFTNLANPLRVRCRLVFVVVAFPPPPVTFPATRLKSEDLSDWRLLQG
jgi:hypothetical protein